MRGVLFRKNASEVSDVTSAVHPCVTVDDFSVASGYRDAHPVRTPGDRCEVADDQDERSVFGPPRNENTLWSLSCKSTHSKPAGSQSF